MLNKKNANIITRTLIHIHACTHTIILRTLIIHVHTNLYTRNKQMHVKKNMVIPPPYQAGHLLCRESRLTT